MKSNQVIIYGKYAVVEALKHKAKIVERIFLDDKKKDDVTLLNLIKKSALKIENFTAQQLSSQANHQGVSAFINLDKLLIPFKTFLESVSVTPSNALILLDEIEDPQNIGAIVRTATAFGASGILIPNRRNAPISGSVAKISAGTIFNIPLIEIGNINTTIKTLKDKGFWIYGLDGTGDKNIHEEKFETPTVIVLGNEGAGIRTKTLGHCDIILSIPISPRCESLNVATAGAMALFEWSKNHPESLH